MIRRKPPSMLTKRVFQEAAACCAFCHESDVAALEIHHIDENPANNVLENLLLVCSTCHSKITHGSISPAAVLTQKRVIQLQAKSHLNTEPERAQNVTVTQTQNTGIIANIVNFKGKRPPKMNYPSDSIGADTIKKSYIDYLYGRYIDYRKADVSFGAFAHSKRFHPGELHRTIQTKFKARTFYIHVARFDELVDYMHGRIDQTILGKRNRKQGTPNYDMFSEYKREQLGSD